MQAISIAYGHTMTEYHSETSVMPRSIALVRYNVLSTHSISIVNVSIVSNIFVPFSISHHATGKILMISLPSGIGSSILLGRDGSDNSTAFWIPRCYVECGKSE